MKGDILKKFNFRLNFLAFSEETYEREYFLSVDYLIYLQFIHSLNTFLLGIAF